MKKNVLFVALALVFATFAISAQNKVAFVGIYDNMSDLQWDDEDMYDAAVWFVNTYGGDYLPISQITPVKLSEYTALWIYYDNDYLAAAPSEIVDNPVVLGYLTDYYKAGGNLLLCTYANLLLENFGRIPNNLEKVLGTGTGFANADQWEVSVTYGTWELAPEFFDLSADPLYAGLQTVLVDRPNGNQYPVVPLNDGGWKEDHNCFWTMAIPGNVIPNDNPDRLKVFQTTYAVQALGSWGHVVDYFGAAVARWLPQGEFAGTAITIGAAAYEWKTNSGAPNQFLDNIKKMTENALNELAGNNTSVKNAKTENVQITISGDMLTISGENIVSAKIYSVTGALLGSYNSGQITAGINVSNLPNGVYIIMIDAAGNVVSEKFVK